MTINHNFFHRLRKHHKDVRFLGDKKWKIGNYEGIRGRYACFLVKQALRHPIHTVHLERLLQLI